MKVFSVISIFAGTVIVGSISTAHFMGQINLMEMSWLWLTFFVGINLFQMGFTGFCPATKILYAVGLKDKQSGCAL
jgi:hypothetical protein